MASQFSWPSVLRLLTSGQDLSTEQAASAMSEILAGDATSAQIAAFIVALRMKGETVDEMVGMLDAMQDGYLRQLGRGTVGVENEYAAFEQCLHFFSNRRDYGLVVMHSRFRK